jgi:hypothetical protein
MPCLASPEYYPFFNKNMITCFIRGCVFSKITNLKSIIFILESTVPTQRLINFLEKDRIELSFLWCKHNRLPLSDFPRNFLISAVNYGTLRAIRYNDMDTTLLNACFTAAYSRTRVLAYSRTHSF